MAGKVTLAIALLLSLTSATTVQAGPIKAKALEAAHTAALEQSGAPNFRRSRLRVWSGLGMIASGLALAFSGKECGTLGSLGPGFVDPAGGGNVAASALAPVHNPGTGCFIEFTLNTSVDSGGQVLSTSRTIRLPRRSDQDFSLWSGAILLEEERVVFVKSVLGSARVVESRARARVATGLGIAAAGVLLATVFAKAPVAVTSLDRSGFSVGTSLDW